MSDRIEGGHERAVAAFHFHPALMSIAAPDGLSGTLSIAQGTTLRWRIAKGAARIEPSTWHPEFGVSLSAQRLLLTLSGGESVIEFSWSIPDAHPFPH